MCIFGVQGAQNKAFALEEQVNAADSDIKVQEKRKGDYDTVGILYVITPSMDKVAINRYFKEAPNGFAEIDEAEYKERKEAAKARMEATDGSK